MKPPQFSYVRAGSLEEACELLAKHGDQASVLAGGQSLMPLLNMRLAAPEVVVDINGIRELEGVSEDNGTLVIGATSRHFDVMTSPLVRERAPVISEALQHVAHPAIRNRGTFAGSIALADPAAELPACCVALEAEIVLRSTSGTRSVRAEDFFLGIFSTARAPEEIVTEIRIPVASHARAYVFDEITRRQGDYALAGLVALGAPSTPRFVFFGVADRPLLARELGKLVGASDSGEIASEAITSALEADLAETAPDGEEAVLKRHLAGVLAARAVPRLENTAKSTSGAR